MPMQSSRPLLRLGCPVRFRDRWQGRLAAFEIDEDWLVLNVVVSPGPFPAVGGRRPLRLRPGLLGRRTRAVDVRDVTLERGVVQLAAQLDALPVYRPNAELLQAV